jgi:hypothetical protein
MFEPLISLAAFAHAFATIGRGDVILGAWIVFAIAALLFGEPDDD